MTKLVCMKERLCVLATALLMGALAGFCQSSLVATGGTARNAQGATAGISIGQPYVSNGDGSLFGIQRNYVVKFTSITTNPILDVEVELNGNVGDLNLDEYFIAKAGETLTYTASSSDENVVRATVDGNTLRLVLQNEGTAVITVVATNSKGEQSSLSYTVSVAPRDPTAVDAVDGETIISVIGKTVAVRNLQGAPIAIYDVMGRCVYSCKSAENVSATISLSGTYVVKAGKKQQTIVIQ